MSRQKTLGEDGYALVEFLVSLPVYLALLLALFAALLFFLKSYVLLLGDWELQQEMRFALERMAQDARMASRVEVMPPGKLHIEDYTEVNGRELVRRTDYELRAGKHGEPPYISKDVSLKNDAGKEISGYAAPQPMTGGRNAFGSLAVVDFSCEERDGLLFLRLEGENRQTKKRISFSTAVCLASVGR